MSSTWMVTGGAGYIGGHAVRALREHGYDVVVLDDLSTGSPARVAGVPLVRASVLDEDAVLAALADHHVDGIMHFAAKKAVAESVERPLYYWRENVEGLRSLLAAAARAGVDRMIYSSSAAVYGDVTPGPGAGGVREDDPCVPVNPYGATKLAGEWMIAAQARATGLRSVALRYFNVAGTTDADLADRGRANLVPLVLDAVAAGRRPTVFGGDYDTPDGSCVRDFVHAQDVADAHVAAIALLDPPRGGSGGPGGPGNGAASRASVLNVGSGRGYSVLQVLAAVSEVTGRDVDPEIVGRRPGDPASVVADVARITGQLGWRPRHGLHDIVADAWAARRHQAAAEVP